MNKTTPETEDVEADGNTVRFINVREGGVGEPSIVIEGGAAPKRKCATCRITLWEGLTGDLCLECLSNREKGGEQR